MAPVDWCALGVCILGKRGDGNDAALALEDPYRAPHSHDSPAWQCPPPSPPPDLTKSTSEVTRMPAGLLPWRRPERCESLGGV